MQTYERLDTNAVTDVLNLVRIGADADGLAALNEQTLLNLRHGDSGAISHLLIREDSGSLSGYANIDLSGPETAGMEMLVHPLHRHRGHGSRLLTEAIAVATRAGRTELHVWAHGDHPIALALADRHGFTRARVLWQMRRRLAGEHTPVVPEGFTIRPFVPGRDEQRLLAVNNAAFAGHPEQGTWTVRDVAMRERESWFDPAGLLLAERIEDGEILGFHWTKVHGEGESAIGEIYVLGVHPDAQGLKLGGALTAAGLAYLRDRGLKTVMLYVDESNRRAVSLYEGSGFQRWTTDVNYQLTL